MVGCDNISELARQHDLRAVIASLIETCKLNGTNPQAWLADTLARLVAGHPASALAALMPWNYPRNVG
jgi:transposase